MTTPLDRARSCAEHLDRAIAALNTAHDAIVAARDDYPDRYGDALYNGVLHNLELVRGYTKMLRVPALAFAGDTDALTTEANR